MSMFEDVPVDVGVIYEGERISRKDMQVELGGPSIKEKFELAKVKPLNEVEDGKIIIIGPDIKDIKEGGAYPLGIIVEVAGFTAGGRKVDGFHGISIEYMCSPKFLDAGGGWNRVVWVPKEIKERVKDFITKEVIDKIATEEDAQNVDDLKDFLKEKAHPVVARWKAEAAVAEEAAPAEAKEEEGAMIPVATASTLPIMAGGFKIILKDAKIYAKKVIICSIKSEKS
jgi:CO dehydrogenase/acetyl-CoA synthase beta subunit